jgi:hypothetical protein
MVSNYSDADQECWLAEYGIDLLRGCGGWPERALGCHKAAVAGRYSGEANMS